MALLFPFLSPSSVSSCLQYLPVASSRGGGDGAGDRCQRIRWRLESVTPLGFQEIPGRESRGVRRRCGVRYDVKYLHYPASVRESLPCADLCLSVSSVLLRCLSMWLQEQGGALSRCRTLSPTLGPRNGGWGRSCIITKFKSRFCIFRVVSYHWGVI